MLFRTGVRRFLRFSGALGALAGRSRAVLDEIEIVNNKTHGYGTANFTRNLTECYHKLVEREVSAEDLPRIMSFTEQILHHPIEIIAGVEETLEYLSEVTA